MGNYEEGREQGRNEVLYLLLVRGDEEVAHDNWHPDRAELLLTTRRWIVSELQNMTRWPKDWPDFKSYTYTSG